MDSNGTNRNKLEQNGRQRKKINYNEMKWNIMAKWNEIDEKEQKKGNKSIEMEQSEI